MESEARFPYEEKSVPTLVHIRRSIFAARGWIGAVIVVLAIYPATPAFSFLKSGTSSAVTPEHGYRVTDLAYDTDPPDANDLTGVSFDVEPAAAKGVMVQLAASGPWFSCTNDGGNVNCPVSGTVGGVQAVTVVGR
jgi:hypothetical protein